MFDFFRRMLSKTPEPEELEDDGGGDSKFLRRTPVLSKRQQIAGYEFSLDQPEMAGRQWHASSQRFFDETLLGQISAPEVAPLIGRRLAFVHLAPASLDLPELRKLPVGKLVLSLKDGAGVGEANPEAVAGQVEALQGRGLQVAMPHTFAKGALANLLTQANYIAIQADQLNPSDLLTTTQQTQRDYSDCKVIARGVDSLELFDVCQTIQFDYLEGNYITQRRDSDEPSLTSQRLVVTQLISQLKRKDADFDQLAMIARQDLALSVRLLRYINSAGMGLSKKIGSLEQAMTIIGQNGLYRWLTLLLFYNSKTSEVDEALRETALARARFCELLARQRLSKADCEQAFVTGLLSMVDVLFRMSMEQAVSHLGLPDEIRQALVDNSGKYGDYLALALACERGDVKTILQLSRKNGLSPAQVNALHIDTLAWAVEYDVNLADRTD